MENLNLLRMKVTINAAIAPKTVTEEFEDLQIKYPGSVKILFMTPPRMENRDDSYSWNTNCKSVKNPLPSASELLAEDFLTP